MRLNIISIIIILIISATPTVSAARTSNNTILIDQGHKQMFFIDQETPLGLSKLADLLNNQGYQLSLQNEAISAEALKGKKIFLTSGLFVPFEKREINELLKYLKEGGSLMMMLHIAPPAGNLLQALGVDFSNGVIHEQEQIIDNQDLNFNIINLENHPVTRGLEQFEAYGVWALMSSNKTNTIIASTGQKAWVDLDGSKTLTPNDAVQSLGIAVAGTYGKGRFVIFGDDAIFQNRFLSENNNKLMQNSLSWLSGD